MSAIQWTDVTWNPTVGCSRVSPGCENCYAEKVAHRGMSPQHKGLTVLGKQGVRWNGEINLVPNALEKPLHWRKPRRVFVDSMSDLFHPGVPFEYVAAVFGVMAACPQHTFQVLTKRPERMVEFFAWLEEQDCGPRTEVCWQALCHEVEHHEDGDNGPLHIKHAAEPDGPWPLPNVWLGVSVEDQQRANERIQKLAECPAAVRFLSCEPLLGAVALNGVVGIEDVDWVIVGGESGPGARACALEWLSSIVDECRDADVPVFVKQLGRVVVSEERKDLDGKWGWYAGLADRKGGDIDEFPEGLQIREFPAVAP